MGMHGVWRKQGQQLTRTTPTRKACIDAVREKKSNSPVNQAESFSCPEKEREKRGKLHEQWAPLIS
jgi:hypothetical protein